MDGTELLDRIRRDLRTRYIPVMFLTGSGDADEAAKLVAGADDFVRKPFRPAELAARVHAILRRVRSSLSLNPLTGLPGNVAIIDELAQRIRNGPPFAFLYVDLDNFKALNDRYGFSRGDDVIRSLAVILTDAAQARGGDASFVGHIGGDDLVAIVEADRGVPVAEEVIDAFDRAIPRFYDEVDRLAGSIGSHDRQGAPRRFPIATVSIGVVSSRRRRFTRPEEVSDVAAELKTLAKRMVGSSYAVDRRTS